MTIKKCLHALISVILMLTLLNTSAMASESLTILSVGFSAYTDVFGNPDESLVTVSVRLSVPEGTEQVSFLLTSEIIPQITDETKSKIIYIDQMAVPSDGAYEFTIEKSRIAGAVGSSNIEGATLYLKVGGVSISEAVTRSVTYHSPTIVICGDADGNGKVNVKDVTVLQRFIVGGYGVTVATAAGDTNRDGIVNAKDVTVLQRYIAGGYGVTLS